MAGKPGMRVEAVEISKEKREIFLTHLAKTGQTKDAARLAGYADSTYLHRLKKNDPEFAAQWQEAIDVFCQDVAEPEVFRRAFQGIEKPQWFKGEIVGYELQYSDAMAMFVLKGLNRKRYGEQVEVSGEVSHRVGIALLPITAPQIEDWERAALDVHATQKRLGPPSEATFIDVTSTPVNTITRG